MSKMKLNGVFMLVIERIFDYAMGLNDGFIVYYVVGFISFIC